MISTACPIIVLDDVKQELWEISHGLGICGLPVIPHWVSGGRLESVPATPHEGVRILFTDLHILGAVHSKPEQYISALVRFIQQLLNPSAYLIVFWSAYPEEADEAWNLLISRLSAINADHLAPFGYRVLDKIEVRNISDPDIEVAARATETVKESISDIFNQFPQLKLIMQWESCASRAASATSNELIGKLKKGGIPFTNNEAVKATLKRMSQEAQGIPHAPKNPTRGVYQALAPIVQDWLEKEAEKRTLDGFLHLIEETLIPLPTAGVNDPALSSLLNDFFIHSEQSNLTPLERGAVIRLPEEFLNNVNGGLVDEIGLDGNTGNWRKAICTEFFMGFSKKTLEQQQPIEASLAPHNVYVVELSADCDYAQDKPRSHRHLLALFVPLSDLSSVYSKSKSQYANDAIYATPDITIGGVLGRLLISCRIFMARAYQKTVEGTTVTRLRQEVISDIGHHYATHMRRPGKIAFF